MTKRVWHKGPPPHVGWWNSRRRDCSNDMWGWWDGKGWSCFSYSSYSAKEAAEQAAERGAVYDGPGVEWTDYYPANARVPRIAP